MAVSIRSVGIQHKPNPKDDRRNHSHKQQAPHQFPCSKPTSKCKPSNYQLPNKHRPISTSAPTFPPSAAKTELILNLITTGSPAANQPVVFHCGNMPATATWSLRSCDPVGSLEPPASRHRRPGKPQSGIPAGSAGYPGCPAGCQRQSRAPRPPRYKHRASTDIEAQPTHLSY